MTPIRWFRALFVALLLGVLTASGLADVARAEDSSAWQITNYETVADVGENGTAKVTTTIDFDFAHDPGHGPFLTFVTRQGVKGDPDHWRQIEIRDIRASSPSGAAANLKKSTSGGVLTLRVGREGRTYTGVQRYVISYTIRGIVEPKQAESQLDEVNWMAIGDGFEVPIRNAKVTLNLPAAPTRTQCWVDSSSNCQRATADGRSVVYQHRNLGRGDYLQTVAGLPVGTFVGAEPTLTPRANPAKAFSLTPQNAGGALAVLLGAGALLLQAFRRHGRDEVYTGLTPGLSPAAGGAEGTSRTSRKAPVAVQFTPPDARPGEIGTLVDEKADRRDVVATLIDLAVRGHIQIAQTGKKDWTFTLLSSPKDDLLPHEHQLLASLFRKQGQVSTQDLRNQSYATLFPTNKKALYKQVVGGRHWFRSNPETTRAVWLGIGIFVTVAGVLAAGLGMVAFNLALPGLALAAVGILTVICSPSMPSRTAEGSAALAQARGFELYLRTAEADQLRFEEGEDIFSRYLPWAIMFGVAERWSKLFEKLAAEGRYDLQPTWYVGNQFGFGYGYLGSSMGSLGDSFSSAMQASQASAAAASARSSGGSGFSGGGGGFGGGGGGGW
ncbi:MULTISPECIES: DUF2207 domain-containing protein [unclassified Luteococcus]|uniref:DUF2207 domain-containing protein n=1 Tax=unclassified Luteococcus TaxID=2639923 RepID=UPI00313E9C30